MLCITFIPKTIYSKNLEDNEISLYPSSCTTYNPTQIQSNCRTDIIFAVDASTTALFPLLFNLEINAIKDQLASNTLDYQKVALAWYNKDVNVNSFGSFNTKVDFDQKLSTIQLGNGFSLSGLLSSLNTFIPTQYDSISTYIFLSHLPVQEIFNSIENAKQLKSKGSLNFIILGNIINVNELKPLDPSNVFYWDFSSQCLTSMVAFFNSSLSCNGKVPETTSTSTTSTTTTITFSTTIVPQTTTTLISSTEESSTTTIPLTTTTVPVTTETTPTPSSTYQDNIIIAIDASTNVLNKDQFEYQKNLVKYNITQNYQNFMLLSVAGYSSTISNIFPYNSISDRQTLINDVTSITQHDGSSLSTLMAKLDTLTIPPGNLQSTFIFISNTTLDEINKSLEYSKSLKNKGALNFIVLGNSLSQSLQSLNPSSIFHFSFIDSNVPSLVSWFNSSMASKNHNEPLSTLPQTTTTTIFTTQTIPYTSTTSTPISTTLYEYTTSILTTSPPITTSTIITSTPTTTIPSASTIITSTPTTTIPLTSTIITSTPTTTIPSTSTIITSTPTTTIPSTSTIITSTPTTTIPLTSTITTTLQSSTPPSSTTVTIPSSTVPCIDGYPETICDGQIILAIDASDNINQTMFNSEIGVVKDNITLGWKDFSKVALTWYDENPNTLFTFRTIESKQIFDNDLIYIKQGHGLSLSKLLKSLSSLNLPSTRTLSTYIFISSTTDEDINNSIEDAKKLSDKGTLNFIVLGKENQLKSLGTLNPSNIFYWDFTTSDITNLVNFFNTSMVCETRCITTTEPPTIGTTTSTYQSTIITTTSTLPTQPTCNNRVFFVVDHRSGITTDDFTNQVLKIKDITSNWNISKNYASIDVNSKRENMIFFNFPNQPKTDVTIFNTSKSWNCLIAYLSQNSVDSNKYCNGTFQIKFPKEPQDQTMDKFLTKFNGQLGSETVDISNFTMVLFTKTATQDEVDKSADIKKIIASETYNIKVVVVKLSNTDNFNYSSLGDSEFYFDDSTLSNDVTNAICN